MTKRRKRHSPEEIVRELQTINRVMAEGASGDEIARHLGISTAALYNWRNRYGAMDVNEAKELKRLRDENDDLKLDVPSSRCGDAPRSLELSEREACR